MPLMLASFLVLLYSVILMNRLFNIHHFRSTYKLLDFCYPKTLYQIVSKIHKILKITNKIRNVLNIRDVFKGKKTLQNRLWSHTPKPILFFLCGISMGTMSSGVIRRRSL